jgi:phospholipid/cholesterol/gamma-HCH transport system permease protein
VNTGDSRMVLRSVSYLGAKAQLLVDRFGLITLFLSESMQSFMRHGVNLDKLSAQINSIGVNSLSIIMMTGASVGSVLAFQTYSGLKQFKTYEFIGPVVVLGMLKEFGPVLSSLMVAGRAGSAMTAEIGTMQITEQVDALRTLGINVKQYLIVPRILATTIILPLLSLFCSLCGIVGGYTIAVWALKVNHEAYLTAIRQNVGMADIFNGLIKAVVFGFLCAVIATYKGYKTRGGAKDVGKSTTESVVYSSLTTLIADYVLTSFLNSFL